MTSEKDDFLDHIQLHVDAFAELANSKAMDEYCTEHQQEILDILEAYEATEAELNKSKGKKRPEDIIDDEFWRMIREA